MIRWWRRAAESWRDHLPLGGVLLLAAVNFSWQLGSSSLFIDEVFSLQDAITSLGGVFHNVRVIEVTPWTYYVFLHEWLGRVGSHADWLARLPSALAGVALVGAVYWMARAFLERGGALLAATLCALSPLVLEYAQEVRVYAFLMLSVTLAVGPTVRAARPEEPHRALLLTLGALASILAVWLHYPALFVVGPLCLWLLFQDEISPRARAVFVAGCAVASLLLAPLFLQQVHRNGIGPAAGVNWGSLLELAETPFDTRSQSEFDPRTVGVDVLDVIAVLVGIVSVALVLSQRLRHRRLLLGLALTAPVLLVFAGLAGSDVVNKRYAAVAAPFMLTVIAAAATRIRLRAAGAVLAAAALAVALIDSLDTHRRAGFYYPAREAVAYIGRDWSPGDVIGSPSQLSALLPVRYYAQQRIRPAPLVFATTPHNLLIALHKRRRIWLIYQLPAHGVHTGALLQAANRQLEPYHYRATRARSFTTVATFAVALIAPV